MDNTSHYDVIVIGTGHAGIEAALAAARMGCTVCAFTMNIDNIGLMPCNPSIGGPAKGQIVAEIDALGGEMARAADITQIQMKVLNRSRGPAVQCLRSQNDKRQYNLYMKHLLLDTPNLDVRQAEITDLIIEESRICGVKTHLGKAYYATSIVITTGTFLNGKIHIGLHNFEAGRDSEQSAKSLTGSLQALGLRTGRLKTGTTPRLDARSLDTSKMIPQPGDPEFLHFSFRTPPNEDYKQQVMCFLTGTTAESHTIIKDNLDRSPLFTNVIEGSGPRYCPSIEDKVMRFSDKDSHQVFIEPEGRDTMEIYAQGLNTSLPEDVQDAFLKTMPGLENVQVLKPGYAVEYDFVYPDQLTPSLEVRDIPGLFLAGQLNGTSGYEEAAGQGIIAGINAALKSQKKDPFILTRESSFIGTMIDDLITKNIYEPYRMLTSRSEYRLLLRQDNAIFRLAHLAHDIGALSDSDFGIVQDHRSAVDMYIKQWKKARTTDKHLNDFKLKQRIPVSELLKRPDVTLEAIVSRETLSSFELDAARRALVEIKYHGYIEKQSRDIEKIQKHEQRRIPDNMDYGRLHGLKRESMEKFEQYRPRTIYDAKKIAGINPADIMILVAHFERG